MNTFVRRGRSETARNAFISGGIAVLVANIALTAPTVLTGKIQLDLHATGAQLTWFSALYGTAAALSGLSFAAIGDRWGRKRVMLVGCSLLVIGSFIGLVAGSVHVLWVAQVVAGLGGGALYTLSLSMIVAATTTPESRAKGIAIWAVLLGIGTSLGSLISGAIVQNGSWRTAYVALTAITAVALMAMALLAPESKAEEVRSNDWLGQVLVIAVTVGICYASLEGSSSGWSSTSVVVGYAASAVLLAAFLLYEANTRCEEPVLRLSLFRSSAFSSAAFMSVVAFISFLGVIYLLSLWLSLADRMSPWQTAYWMLPSSVVVIVLYPLLSRVLPRISGRWLLGIGSLPLAVGELWLATQPTHLTYGDVIGPVILVGIGFSFLVNSLTASAVNSVPIQVGSMAAGTSDLLSLLGRVLGIAVIGAIALSTASSRLTSKLGHLALPPSQLHLVEGVQKGGGVIAVASAPLGPVSTKVGPVAVQSLIEGFHVGLVVSAILLVVAAMVALVFLRDDPSHLILEDDDRLTVLVDDRGAATAPAPAAEPSA